jgi:hypothetical protein
MAKWSFWLDRIQIWGQLRDYFAWWELDNLDRYPEYRQLIEAKHCDVSTFDVESYARNPFLFRPSDDSHSAKLAWLLVR